MSTTSRKIGYYNLIFKKHGKDEHFFDKQHFLNFLVYLDSKAAMVDIPKKSKAFSLSFYRYEQLSGLDIVDLTFKSCKYNHSPELMSKINGNERPSDKKLEEGEKELTHLVLNVSNVDAEIIFEERRSGIAIGEFVKYISKYYKEYNTSIGKPNNHSFEYGMNTTESFLQSLRNVHEIKIGEVYTDKQILGSEMLNLTDRTERSLSDEVVIKIKAEPKQSLGKRTIKNIFDSIGTTNSKVSRIRIYGKDNNNNGIRIDSKILQQVDYLDVELLPNGVVNSQSIFDKMHDTIREGLSQEAV